MRKTVFVAMFLIAGPLFVAKAEAQSGAVIPQGGAGHAGGASCVILKRMGPADEVTSHLYSFGFRGKQFQYVEGKLPEGSPFHGRLTDHDVRNLQGRGTEVEVLESHYTAEDLKQAREQCESMTGKNPNQTTGAPAAPEQNGAKSASPPPAPQTMNNDVVIKMVKAGLTDDVIVDTIKASPGTYDTSANGLIALKQAGVSDKVIAAIVVKNLGATPAPK